MAPQIRGGGRGEWGLLVPTRTVGRPSGPFRPCPPFRKHPPPPASPAARAARARHSETVTPLAAGNDPMEADSTRMLRILHTADVHLGARHADLGEAAAGQRERQFAAFKMTIDLALGEKV